MRALRVIAIFAVVVGILGYGLFLGYFDRGKFEIKQSEWSPSGKVAIVAERSDDQALGGYDFFVLISDHLPSSRELSRAYHSDAPVFRAANDCLRIKWQEANQLEIACNGLFKPGEINAQKTHSGNIDITYRNIPIVR